MEARPKNRKAQIRKKAQNMFHTKGYAATSMRDLAKEVGVEPASLYNHITSKEHLLQDICFHMADEFFEMVQPLTKSNELPDVKLRNMMSAHISVIARNLDASSVFFNEWRHLSDPHLSRFKSLRRKYSNIFRTILQEGIEQDDFKKIDVKITLFTIFSALNATYDLYKPNGKMTEKMIADKISGIILDGLKKHSTTKNL